MELQAACRHMGLQYRHEWCASCFNHLPLAFVESRRAQAKLQTNSHDPLEQMVFRRVIQLHFRETGNVDRRIGGVVRPCTVNTFASGTWNFGLWLRKLQTGNLRQYVMFIVVGTVLLFVAITFVQSYLTPTQNL
jgi:hypothetical protein